MALPERHDPIEALVSGRAAQHATARLVSAKPLRSGAVAMHYRREPFALRWKDIDEQQQLVPTSSCRGISHARQP